MSLQREKGVAEKSSCKPCKISTCPARWARNNPRKHVYVPQKYKRKQHFPTCSIERHVAALKHKNKAVETCSVYIHICWLAVFFFPCFLLQYCTFHGVSSVFLNITNKCLYMFYETMKTNQSRVIWFVHDC